MFVDQTKIDVQAGKGGDGALLFDMRNMFHLVDQPVETEAAEAVLF